MAIKPVLQYRNADSTLDLNSTQARIIDRAIFDGGTLSLSATTLQVTVAPFIATGFDGMIAISDSNEVRSVPAPAAAGPARVSYLILHLEYRTLTSSLSNLQVVPESTWLSSVSRNFFVTFAKFSIPFGATSLTDPGVTVDYSVGDWADKLGKTGWRMPVANLAALPVVGNRDGDLRITLDTHQGHVWNSTLSSWSSFGGAVDLQDVAARNAEHRHQWHRVTSGSGFINEILSSDGSTTAGVAVTSLTDQGVGFPFIPLNGVANLASVPGCHFMVNGHFVKTHARELVFSAPPGVGERFDLLLLEVWRQTVAVPSSVTYPSVVPTATSSFASLRAALETLAEDGGTLAHSYDFSELEAISSTELAVTAYQFRVIPNVSSSVLLNPSTVASSINNIDGNAFNTLGNDKRIWQAAAATSSVDSVSWAIPLTVVRRSSLELSGPPYLDTYKVSGLSNISERFIFDVAPRAELGLGLLETTNNVKELNRVSALSKQFQHPSGFLKGATDAYTIADGSITFPPSVISILGSDLVLPLSYSIPLPPPPAGGGVTRTDLVVLEVFKTLHSPPARVGAGAPQLSGRIAAGTRQEQWVARPRVIQLPTSETTLDGAMTASALYTPQASEPALWKRTSAVTEDLNAVFALPLCLVHRRNTTPYAPTPTGQNGADRSAYPGLPNRPASFPYPGEILDLRSHIALSSEELQRTLDESFDKLIAGELRTNMRVHPIVSNVTGTQLLQVDQISAVPTAGIYTLPSAPNGKTTVWSESDEAELVTWSFTNMTIDANDSRGVFAWNSALQQLEIICPSGYHLSLDPRLSTWAFGPQRGIAWSTGPSPNQEPQAMVATPFSGAIPGGWEVIGDPTTPTLLKQTSVDLALSASALSLYSPSAATIHVGVWMVRKNHEAGRSVSPNTYSNNRGLFAVPDLVHRVDYSLTGAAPFKRAWVGPILNTIDIPVVGDFITISQAALFASGSISSQIASSSVSLKSYAVTDISLNTVGVAPNIETIEFSSGISPGFDDVAISFVASSVPPGTTARVTLLCSGDLVDRWFEFDPGSKQVRGPYRVGFNQFSIPLGGDHIGASVGVAESLVPYSDCGLNVLGSIIPGSLVTSSNPLTSVLSGELSFYAAGSGNKNWQIWFDPSLRSAADNIDPAQSIALQEAVSAGLPVPLGSYNQLFTVRYSGSGSAHNSLVLGCVRSPLPPAAVARIFYEYTPYQGISQSLESKINGTVEAISSDLVFTCGPNRPWLDPRMLSTTILNLTDPVIPAGTALSSDLGLLGSSGRVTDRTLGLVQGGLGNSSYQGWFVSTAKDRRFRPEDRHPIAVSQRLPYPSKQPDGIAASSYVPESFLGNAALLSSPVVRTVTPSSFYTKNEASPWLLEFSSVSTSTKMWKSVAASKTLYIPVPANQGETLTGLTLEVESLGPSASLSCSFALRSRDTGALGASTREFLVPVFGPSGTRSLSEINLPSPAGGPLSGRPQSELVLVVVSPGSNILVGAVNFSVVDSLSLVSGGTTFLRYPYDSISGTGRSLRKGMNIQVPSTWTSELSNYVLGTIQDGRQDVTGLSPSRGKSTVVLGGPGVVYGVGGGLVGYVPGGDFFGSVYSSLYNAAPTPIGREAPPRFSTRSHPVTTGANAADCAVGAASAYLVKNAVDATYMGVSTGYTPLGPTGSTYTRVGAAVDAFYPVGRPVFRRT